MDFKRWKLPEKYHKIWCHPMLWVSLVLILIGVIGHIALPHVFLALLHKQLYLAEGKEVYANWKNTPIPVSFKMYIFNVTNPIEIEKFGAKPNLQEVGPFVFTEFRSKNVTSWNSDEKSVTYEDLKQYHFEPSLSKDPDEKVYTVNLPLQGFLMLAEEFNHFADFVRSTLRNMFAKYNEQLFVHRTPRELLFEGYKVEMIEDLMQRLRSIAEVPQFLPNNTFGLMYGKNNSGDGIFTVFTGEDDISKYSKIVRWNNASKTHFWNDDFCDMINGTDGSQFPPPVTKKDVLYVYTAELCRSLFLEYEEDVDVLGIPALRFITPERLFASPYQNPDNMCYCKNEKYRHFGGILNVSPCANGLNLAVTGPHFYLAHHEIQQNVTGLHPNSESHKSYADIEPSTGFVLRASRKLQINFIMKPNEYFSQTEKAPMSVVPLIWVVEEAAIDQKVASLFISMVRIPIKATKSVLTACVVFGTLFVATAGFISLYLLIKQQKQPKDVIPNKHKADPHNSQDP